MNKLSCKEKKIHSVRNLRFIRIELTKNKYFMIDIYNNKLQNFKLINKGNQSQITTLPSDLLEITNYFQNSKSISKFKKYFQQNIVIQQSLQNSQIPILKLKTNQLLGGGCGTSKNQVDDVQKKLQKERTKSLKTKLTNFKIDDQFVSEYKEWIYNYDIIIENMLSPDLRSPVPKSTTDLMKKDQIIANDENIHKDESNKDKNENHHDKKVKKDQKENDHNKKNEEKEEKLKKKEEKQDEKELSDNDSENSESNQEQEQTNLRAEIFKLEEFFYKFRKNLGDDIAKYKTYYQEIFEIYLQFAFLSSNQSSSDTKELIATQKKKLGEMRVILESQMNKQPTLDLIFYLNLFEKIRDGNFSIPNVKKLTKLINQFKYVVSKTCTAGSIAMQVFNGKVMVGIENIFSLYQSILSDIEVSDSKNLFQLLFQIQIERIQSLQQKTDKNILNISNEVIFYIQKFNKIIEDKKDEEQESLIIYFLIKVNQLMEKLLSIKQQIKGEKNEKLLQSKLQEFSEQTQPIHTDVLNKFILYLIQEGEDASFFDIFKKLFHLQVGNFHLRYITLSLQLKIRKLLSMNGQEQDPLFKLLTMNLFRRYLEETEESVKNLLYTDYYFQKFLKTGSKQKDSQLKEKLICDEQFIKEYLELDKTWKSRILQVNKGGEGTYKLYQTFDSVCQKLKENSKIITQIIK